MFSKISVRLLLASAALSLGSPLAAQYIDRAPPPPAAPLPGVIETPADALARNVRLLALSPRDFNALVAAGHAALDMGDTEAAIGFFGRAEEMQPGASQPKIGLGAAMVQMSDPQGAMRYFEQARLLGATPANMALDRGMARDLMGDLGGAQSDYRLALFGKSSDEARRRLALSLAIGRDRSGALDAIQPLLNRRDVAAQRVRAFVLALTGDRIGATQAIEAVMPGAGARFDPFFRYLPNLSIAEKAAAVHLGVFPEDAATRVAQAAPLQAPPVRVAQAPPPPVRPNFTTTVRPNSASVSSPVAAVRHDPVVNAPAVSSPSFILPSAISAGSTVSTSAPTVAAVSAPVETIVLPEPAASDDVKSVEPAAAMADVAPATGETRLSGIDKLLATIGEAPAAEHPMQLGAAPLKAEEAVPKPVVSAKAAREAKAAAAKKAAEKKVREEKAAAEKKAKEEAARLGVAGTNWVQLAGGSSEARMPIEYRKLAAKAGKLLKRPGYVTGGKDYFRLLVGPFDSKSDAQAFVNRLAKEGVDGFSWTRTPAQIRIEKLPSK